MQLMVSVGMSTPNNNSNLGCVGYSMLLSSSGKNMGRSWESLEE